MEVDDDPATAEEEQKFANGPEITGAHAQSETTIGRFGSNIRLVRGSGRINPPQKKESVEFFLNVSLNSVTKMIVFTVKRARTCHLFRKCPGCCHSVSKTHVRDRIYRLSQIHASVIYQILLIY